MANQKNIVIMRGDTFVFDVKLTDVEATVTSMFFSAKRKATDTEYVFQKSIGDGITLVSTNTYRVRLAPEDTESLEAGNYDYDLQLGMGSDVYTLLYGSLGLMQDVTEGTE